MTMEEAFQCGDGDIPFNNDHGGFNTAKLHVKKEILGDDPPIVMNPAHGLSDKWQVWKVIKAEPEVMTAEWYVNRFEPRQASASPMKYSVEDMMICFEQADQNGQLKEQKRVSPLIEAVKRACYGAGMAGTTIEREFNNLKPPQ